ncbi:hypothetical protein ABEF92_007007 [Exophiala dermatitidis]|uniref:Uncharacterized protein n=1 Tax=Exophiala dermatitidis (strain ATCC 34100 / CBS 525.76 / NIH/UT8656) TaxID=858893 RepID=H6C9M2_EXODN|nr:uncharacterized protein HMPREF1120_08684 [Exophiala dermatitidis NIH/UT8656]EHY60738.1 hypothetical protein HMPREF1120_08684 [Exophiala dermatitidis NIH/UT8656]
MAAAEYFASGARPPYEQTNSLYPPPPGRPQRAHSQPGRTYPPPQPSHSSPQLPPVHHVPYVSPPPPYQPLTTESKPSPYLAPHQSSSAQQRPSISYQQRPDQYSMSLPNYQAWPPSTPQHGAMAPQPYPYQQQIYPPYASRPSLSIRDAGIGDGYASDPEQRRRKHKSRSRRISDNSRSTNADGFIGAAGGGLLGDLLFPGLGTVGGALVGWVGGKDYGKHRKWREEKRDRDQERWERKFGRSHSRSRSRSRDERRDSHDRRKSYD